MSKRKSKISSNPALISVSKRVLLPTNFRQEEFSKAFVHAVASVAGYSVEIVSVDIDGVDLTFKSTSDHTELASPQLNAQLKCTWTHSVEVNHINYDLKSANYNHLIKRCHVPRILI
jgi:Domain of unknown function (DUF4365)